MSMYYDRNGGPISMDQWISSFTETGKRVARTEITPNLFVSTVWLGLDHSFGGGPPLIFESMVFEDGKSGDMRRYTTEDEARAGHDEMVAEQTKRAGH